MKILMFGWEFPPHISGGLGTACFGLTKGLSAFKDIEIKFVVPKLYGGENNKIAKIISAGNVRIKEKRFEYEKIWEKMTYIKVDSPIMPYLSPEEYEARRAKEEKKKKKGEFYFSGKYGTQLIEEVANYAKIATVIANKNKFDIIHAHDWLTYAAGIEVKKMTKKPLIVHVHSTEFDRSGKNINQQIYMLEKKGMQAADKIIAVSELTKQTIIKQYNISEDKIITIHNAVEADNTNEKETIRKNVKEKIVTFLGRITYQKGPEYFVEAAHKVLQKTEELRFVMAGDGDMLNEMIKRAAQLGITNRFHFTGFLNKEEVNKIFSISDLYVMPSVSEPFGISPLEAMRSAVPVIISKQSGVAEIVKQATKIDFWDVEEIANAILTILNNKALSTNFKIKGKEEVEKIKWEDTAKKIRQVYINTSLNCNS